MKPADTNQPHPSQATPVSPTPSSAPPALRTDIVNNIPIRSQTETTNGHAESTNRELDRIIHDVDVEKKAAPKKNFFSKNTKPKRQKTFSEAPDYHRQNQTLPQALPPRRMPALTIFLTIIVTGLLAAAAFYAYR